MFSFSSTFFFSIFFSWISSTLLSLLFSNIVFKLLCDFLEFLASTSSKHQVASKISWVLSAIMVFLFISWFVFCFCDEDGCGGASDGGFILLMNFPPFHHLFTHVPFLQVRNMEFSCFLSFFQGIHFLSWKLKRIENRKFEFARLRHGLLERKMN